MNGKRLTSLVWFVLFLLLPWPATVTAAASEVDFPTQLTLEHDNKEEERQQVESFIGRLFDERAQMLIHSTSEALDEYYLTAEATGKQALKLEKQRTEYVQAWADKRLLTFNEAESRVRIVRLNVSGNQARVSLVQSLKLSYAYNAKPDQPQHFGIGTRHVLTLRQKDGHWKVTREWYLDPLTENPKLIPELEPTQNGVPFFRTDGVSTSSPNSNSIGYQRERAVEYANKYAGIAWGAGNNNRYNQKYRDYAHLGGDCTNFASQVIGDPEEGGGLKMTSRWRYRYNVGGNEGWVRTDSFKNFLLYSGYGQLVARGTFEAVTTRTDKHPDGAFASIQPGDLIAYEMNGDVDHFSIVVGFDDYGYPLVNSHSADRYRVPFDLGWDKYTKYWLIHIKD
ncbi:amidase domain-containing protein [Paenibacillus sp. J2TS4]|uniref:amidase domain-containing protein n=1 Tax=Paenibacillus sp. J2TS4 TaxID=2807194 RepID=UPI001B1F1AAE|nr:amidase domain-containing protein [Paenibacillus sp. J2TS4]GIP31658.1 hypothetical protein J2TS4_08680 [Paenibacillus sp. J2TS4]